MNLHKVVAYGLLSWDGVAEKPDEFVADWDDQMEVNLASVIATQNAILGGEGMGRGQSSDIEPFATFINGVSK